VTSEREGMSRVTEILEKRASEPKKRRSREREPQYERKSTEQYLQKGDDVKERSPNIEGSRGEETPQNRRKLMRTTHRR
jgi:hypothetical protein